MLNTNPEMRIHPEDILKHPWFFITSPDKLSEATSSPEFSHKVINASKIRSLSDVEAMD